MALEDAAVLAQTLQSRHAFQYYEDARRQRVEALVAYAASIDKQKRVARSRFAVMMRDLMLPMFLRKAARDHSTDWIFDYDVRRTSGDR